jgi:hypothetical protein
MKTNLHVEFLPSTEISVPSIVFELKFLSLLCISVEHNANRNFSDDSSDQIKFGDMGFMIYKKDSPKNKKWFDKDLKKSRLNLINYGKIYSTLKVVCFSNMSSWISRFFNRSLNSSFT